MRDSGVFCFSTLIGPLVLRYEAAPFRLQSVDLAPEKKVPAPEPVGSNPLEEVSAIGRLLLTYFQRVPITPPWHLLSMDHLTALQQKVLYETAQIPYGTRKTYKCLAGAIGRPRACRFVGSALGKNPFPLIIPCHRVIRSDGRFGHFGSGPKLKKWLLTFEAGQNLH